MLRHIDYYKFTMGQMLWKYEPFTDVTYTFRDRSEALQIPDDLQAELDLVRDQGFFPEELSHLVDLGFSPDYVHFLNTHPLPRVYVEGNRIQVHGPAPLASLWETVVLAKVNDLLSRRVPAAFVPNQGSNRLAEKIRILKDNPEVKIIEFGTRRRHSEWWQRQVISQLLEHCPENLLGTSNVGMAKEFGIKAMGSFAHELPMIWAALADLRGTSVLRSHGLFLEAYYEMYGPSIALTDTFGSDFFFQDFAKPNDWTGLRHDSGDPWVFGEKAIKYYESKGIDPTTKTILFSDGLNLDKILQLYFAFSDRINVMFGWGTDLTNDVGVPPTNIVMKATGVASNYADRGPRFKECVKLSDVSGKYTGSPDKVKQYKSIFKVV